MAGRSYFRTCKSYLQLISECHSQCFDALTAHLAVVLRGYLMITLEQRRSEDDRSLREIFFTDELVDIIFDKSFRIIMPAMMKCICAIFQPTED